MTKWKAIAHWRIPGPESPYWPLRNVIWGMPWIGKRWHAYDAAHAGAQEGGFRLPGKYYS